MTRYLDSIEQRNALDQAIRRYIGQRSDGEEVSCQDVATVVLICDALECHYHDRWQAGLRETAQYLGDSPPPIPVEDTDTTRRRWRVERAALHPPIAQVKAEAKRRPSS